MADACGLSPGLCVSERRVRSCPRRDDHVTRNCRAVLCSRRALWLWPTGGRDAVGGGPVRPTGLPRGAACGAGRGPGRVYVAVAAGDSRAAGGSPSALHRENLEGPGGEARERAGPPAGVRRTERWLLWGPFLAPGSWHRRVSVRSVRGPDPTDSEDRPSPQATARRWPKAGRRFSTCSPLFSLPGRTGVMAAQLPACRT